MALFSGVAVAAKDHELMALLGELVTPCAEHVVVFGVGGGVLGTGHQWLGLIDAACGRFDPALEHFAEAKSIALRMGAPYWVADATVATARVLRSRGRAADDAEISRLVADARATARRGGYGRVLAQCDLMA